MCAFSLTQMPGCAYSEVSKERKALERGIAMYRNRYDDNCEYDDYDSYRGFDEPKAEQDCGCRCDRDFDDNRAVEDEQGFAQEYYDCDGDGGSACDCGCGCNRPPRPPRPYPGIGPTGPMGPRGPRGPQGPRGLQGPQGREGLQGLRGPQGNTGPQGVAGVQGPTGSTGPQGMPGEPGATGARGATGAQGPQGPQGATGPAGESAPLVQFASVSLQSFTDKQFCAQDAFVFDVGSIQSGFTISDDYQSVIAGHAGTYVVQFGCLLASQPCEGDAVALELNSSMIIEESRIPMLCEGSFVQGSCIVELGEGDSLRMVSDTAQGVNVCSFNNTVNAYLIVYQIN